MSLTDRQSEILGLIRQQGRVSVEDLAGDYAVTTQTIRRDLNELCTRGLATRVHGGARGPAAVTNLGYHARRNVNAAGKEAIGRAAAALIPNDCAVALNIGTTTEQVARALGGHSNLVVLSNNINIISGLMGSDVQELILVGGSVRPSDGAVVGAEAVAFIDRYKVDYAIIGASALDPDGAVLDYDGAEVSVARAILRNARVRILVADQTKFTRSAPVRICDLRELDHVITDAPPPEQFMRNASEAGTEVTVATAGGQSNDNG